MTELGVADAREIAAEAPQYNCSIVAREDMHESLIYVWVRFDGDPTPFLPGQYMTIGVFADGKLVQRPYSVASDPAVAGGSGYEFYVRLVQGGAFTPLLWQLPLGARMRMIGPKGKFTLEPDDDRTHLFISTGTGNAPFVSMMKSMLREGRPRKAVFINGVSYVADLGYRDLLEGWQATGEYPVAYVPTVSRPKEPANAGWTGWTGRTEAVLPRALSEYRLSPEDTIAYICGNPDMIIAADEFLREAGFPETQIKKELYWPKGKEPRSLGPAGVAVPAPGGLSPAGDEDE
jgi:ferredoxin/flavodoxin---NADP+ reductase